MDKTDISLKFLEKYPNVDLDILTEYLVLCSSSKDYSNSDLMCKHHILPKSIWPEFENFSEYPWNRADLNYKDHCLAHVHLASLIDNFGMHYALQFMTGHKDFLSVAENDKQFLLEEAQKRYERCNKLRSESLMGHTLSPEGRLKISIANKGRPNPGVSAALTGRTLPLEVRQKQSNSLMGRPKSDAARLSMRNAQRNTPIWTDKGLYLTLWDLFLENSQVEFIKPSQRKRFAKICNNSNRLVYNNKPYVIVKSGFVVGILRHFNAVISKTEELLF